jgi:hypothetical protein
MSDSAPFGTPFDVKNFPNLYPENIQDEVNEFYQHDKVLPRIEGQDYNEESTNPSQETSKGYSQEGKDNY